MCPSCKAIFSGYNWGLRSLKMAGVIGDSRFHLVPISGCRLVKNSLQVSWILIFYPQQATCAKVTCFWTYIHIYIWKLSVWGHHCGLLSYDKESNSIAPCKILNVYTCSHTFILLLCLCLIIYQQGLYTCCKQSPWICYLLACAFLWLTGTQKTLKNLIFFPTIYFQQVSLQAAYGFA